MSDIKKEIDKIDKIIETVNYSYVRIEIETKNQHYLIEKDKHTPIGFRAGDKIE